MLDSGPLVLSTDARLYISNESEIRRNVDDDPAPAIYPGREPINYKLLLPDGGTVLGDKTMVLFKSCERCSGDRVAESDHEGPYVICLACGHVTYPKNLSDKLAAAASKRKTA